MRTLRCLSLVAALCFALGTKAAENARQIASATFPSVVLLVMEDERGQPVSLGSGFFVKEKVIASNFHVVEKAARGYAKLVGQKSKYNIAGVVGLDSRHDLVLLAVEDATAPALKIGDGSKVAVGDTVFAVGNPQGLEGTFSQGIVSGIRQFDTDSLLQITAPISPGSSGGPVVDSEGKAVGVAVATFKGGQNLNFAIPAKYVDESLQKAGKPESLSSKTSKASKSILDEIGGSKSTEGVYAHNLDPQFLIIGKFSFSLANRLRQPVKNIKCLVIFYNTDESPLDFSVVEYSEVIPAGLGKRVEGKSLRALAISTNGKKAKSNSVSSASKSNRNSEILSPMNWDFIARTPDELARIGNALFRARKQKHLDEQVQMTRALEALSATSILHFPFRVRHTGESEVPDFQLKSGGHAIAVEVAKIAVQDVEHARGLQQRELNQTLAISNLYRKQSKRRTKSEVIAEGFLIPQMVFPVSVEEHSQIWIEALAVQLAEKTTVLNSDRFIHGNEDWLLLWDRIGTSDWELETRIQSVSSILTPFWNEGWYSRVFLQAEHFHWTMMFTSGEHTLLNPAATG